MSIEQNKAAVLRLNAAINAGDFDELHELFADDYIFHISPEIKGVKAIKWHFIAQRNAFPDYHEEVELMVAEGDWVAVFYKISGTFMNDFRGISQTGKSFSYPICVLARFRDGKQIEARPYYDTMQAYQQLGITTNE